MSEPLEHIIAKRDSFPLIWNLLAPRDEFRDLYPLCLRRWNAMTYRAQQRLYWYLREKKRKGEKIYDNPLYALTYTKPYPFNWRGVASIDAQFKREKMVSAFYNGSFGIYPQNVADYFEMTHITPLN